MLWVEGLKKSRVAGALDAFYGVGLIPIKAKGQVFSGISGSGTRLDLIFGWYFVAVVFFCYYSPFP